MPVVPLKVIGQSTREIMMMIHDDDASSKEEPRLLDHRIEGPFCSTDLCVYFCASTIDVFLVIFAWRTMIPYSGGICSTQTLSIWAVLSEVSKAGMSNLLFHIIRKYLLVMFIYSFKKYLLSICSIPGTELSVADKEMYDMVYFLSELTFW